MTAAVAEALHPVPLVPGPAVYYPAIPGPRNMLLDSLAAQPGRKSIYVEFYDPGGLRYGIPTYPWRAAPDGWLTRRQLRAVGLRPGGQQRCGQVVWKHRGRERRADLFLRSLALPVHEMTPAMWVRHHTMMAARMTCPVCDEIRGYCISRALGMCNDCAAGEVLPGVPASVGAARRFVAGQLGAGHPSAEAAVLAVSELATNAICYSRSGDGGTFLVAVTAGPAAVVVRVIDQGSESVPAAAAPAGPGAEHGRGLALVAAVALEWGTHPTKAGRSTWCRLAGDAVPGGLAAAAAGEPPSRACARVPVHVHPRVGAAVGGAA